MSNYKIKKSSKSSTLRDVDLKLQVYYVYILQCEGDILYTGIATDYKRRFDEHSNVNGSSQRRLWPCGRQRIEAKHQNLNLE